MAVRDRTNIFEMRERATVRHAEHLITSASVERHPERDVDELRAALHNADSVADAAQQLDCPRSGVRRWASIYALAHAMPPEGER